VYGWGCVVACVDRCMCVYIIYYRARFLLFSPGMTSLLCKYEHVDVYGYICVCVCIQHGRSLSHHNLVCTPLHYAHL